MKKFVLWAPRVLSILFIVFISLFALDAFDGDSLWWKKIVGFLIHLVPTYLLIACLVLSWKWKLFGGILFCGLGIFYIVMAWDNFEFLTYFLIAGPAFLTGGLFILGHFMKIKQR